MITFVELSRLSRTEAADLTWQLLKERPASANISHRGMPNRREHEEFVWNYPYQIWYAILNEKGQFLGTVYLTKKNEIGIFILKEHQGQGHAKNAVQMLMRWHKPHPVLLGQRPDPFLANVAPDNQASHALFQKLGGKVIQWTYELP